MFRSISRRRQLRSQARARTPVAKTENNSNQMKSNPQQQQQQVCDDEKVETNDIWEKSQQKSRLRCPSKTTLPTRNTSTKSTLISRCCCERCNRRFQIQQNRQDCECEFVVERARPKKLYKCQKCKMKKCLCSLKTPSNVKIEIESKKIACESGKCECKRKPKQSNFNDVKKFSVKGTLVATKK